MTQQGILDSSHFVQNNPEIGMRGSILGSGGDCAPISALGTRSIPQSVQTISLIQKCFGLPNIQCACDAVAISSLAKVPQLLQGNPKIKVEMRISAVNRN